MRRLWRGPVWRHTARRAHAASAASLCSSGRREDLTMHANRARQNAVRAARMGVTLLVAGCGATLGPTPSPVASTSAGAGPACQGDGYTVAYPPGWFAHPGDNDLNLEPCRLFAAEPFDAPQVETDWGWHPA